MEAVGARDHDRRHPISPPHLRAAAQTNDDLVRGGRQVPKGHLLAEHAAEPAGVRQRADQHEPRLAPRRDRQLQPVPLNLLARRVVDLDRRRLPGPVLTGHADRPELQPPDLADQGRIGPIEPGVDQLAEQHGRLDVRVLDEPGLQIGAERFKAARRRRPVLTGAIAGEVLPDGLAVPAGMPGDRRRIPATLRERVYLHVVLLCEHPLRVLLASSNGLKNHGR